MRQSFLSIITLVLSLILFSCGKDDPAPESAPPPPPVVEPAVNPEPPAPTTWEEVRDAMYEKSSTEGLGVAENNLVCHSYYPYGSTDCGLYGSTTASYSVNINLAGIFNSDPVFTTTPTDTYRLYQVTSVEGDVLKYKDEDEVEHVFDKNAHLKAIFEPTLSVPLGYTLEKKVEPLKVQVGGVEVNAFKIQYFRKNTLTTGSGGYGYPGYFPPTYPTTSPAPSGELVAEALVSLEIPVLLNPIALQNMNQLSENLQLSIQNVITP